MIVHLYSCDAWQVGLGPLNIEYTLLRVCSQCSRSGCGQTGCLERTAGLQSACRRLQAYKLMSMLVTPAPCMLPAPCMPAFACMVCGTSLLVPRNCFGLQRVMQSRVLLPWGLFTLVCGICWGWHSCCLCGCGSRPCLAASCTCTCTCMALQEECQGPL